MQQALRAACGWSRAWAIPEAGPPWCECPSTLLLTQPLLCAQNQEADVVGEPLARERPQVAFERF